MDSPVIFFLAWLASRLQSSKIQERPEIRKKARKQKKRAEKTNEK
jgi:hypothetical protein